MSIEQYKSAVIISVRYRNKDITIKTMALSIEIDAVVPKKFIHRSTYFSHRVVRSVDKKNMFRKVLRCANDLVNVVDNNPY